MENKTDYNRIQLHVLSSEDLMLINLTQKTNNNLIRILVSVLWRPLLTKSRQVNHCISTPVETPILVGIIP